MGTCTGDRMGQRWSPARFTDVLTPNAGIDVVRLDDGRSVPEAIGSVYGALLYSFPILQHPVKPTVAYQAHIGPQPESQARNGWPLYPRYCCLKRRRRHMDACHEPRGSPLGSAPPPACAQAPAAFRRVVASQPQAAPFRSKPAYANLYAKPRVFPRLARADTFSSLVLRLTECSKRTRYRVLLPSRHPGAAHAAGAEPSIALISGSDPVRIQIRRPCSHQGSDRHVHITYTWGR